MVNSWMPAICIKCRKGLTDKEKDIGLPLCQDCMSSLTDTVMGKMMVSEKKKVEQEIDNFSRFISSSGNLFKLDDITIIQCSFNIFMRKVSELKDKNLAISEKIFTDAIKFIERELENIKNKNVGHHDRLSIFDDIIRSCGGSNNGDDNKRYDIEDTEDTEDGHHSRDDDKDVKKREDVVDDNTVTNNAKDKGDIMEKIKKGEKKDSKFFQG